MGLFLSIIIYGCSLLVIRDKFKGTPHFVLLEDFFENGFVVLGIFIMLGYTRHKYLNLIVESSVKVLFIVWVVLVLQFSSRPQLEQNAWIVGAAFTFIYLEVLLRLNDYFFDIKQYQCKKIKFIDTIFIRNLSVPFSIASLAIVNILISFPIEDLLDIIVDIQ
jgi:hypothetical protein